MRVIAYPLGDRTKLLDFPVYRTLNFPFYRRTAPGPDLLKVGFLDPLLARLVTRVAKSDDVDVIHAHHFEGLLTALYARYRTGVPVVYDAHTTLAGELPYYVRGWRGRIAYRLGRWLDRILPRLADHVSATSEGIAQSLMTDGLTGDQVTVIGNVVEDHVIAAGNSVDRESAKPGCERIVYAGSLAPYQRLDLLIAAFSQVLDHRPGARLTVVTDDAPEKLNALYGWQAISAAVDMVPAGTPADMVRYLASQADVLVNPRVECPGYPFKLLNYMAAGRPIVSYALSARGLSHGEDAWLVDDVSAEGLAEGIHCVLSNPDLGRKLGDGARAALVDDLRWTGMVAQLEGVYARVTASATVEGALGIAGKVSVDGGND